MSAAIAIAIANIATTKVDWVPKPKTTSIPLLVPKYKLLWHGMPAS